LIVGNTSVTGGSSQIYYIDNVPSATSYTWTLPSGWNGSSSSNAITTTAGSSGGAISVRSNNECGSSAARTLSVTVNNAAGNLALNENAYASSIETAAFPPGNAADGNMGTRWASQYTNTEWIYVDLGATYNVNRVKINWEAAYGRNYQIQISSNASTWQNMANIRNNSQLVRDHTGLSGTGRYVRILGSQRGTAYGYSIFELEVYGTPAVQLISAESKIENPDPFIIYPNPTIGPMTIKFELDKDNMMTLEVFDLKGAKVHDILNRQVQKAGNYEYLFSAPKPGAYLLKIIMGEKVFTKQLIQY
jgi:hypothetical protein